MKFLFFQVSAVTWYVRKYRNVLPGTSPVSRSWSSLSICKRNECPSTVAVKCALLPLLRVGIAEFLLRYSWDFSKRNSISFFKELRGWLDSNRGGFDKAKLRGFTRVSPYRVEMLNKNVSPKGTMYPRTKFLPKIGLLIVSKASLETKTQISL